MRNRMGYWDTVLMAIHNLCSRKMRTALNLLGVVISSVLLLMTFAATRGASDGIMNIIDSSNQARQFLILASPNQNTKVPESAVKIEGDVDPWRRKRLEKALRKKWIAANAKRIYLTEDILTRLRSIEGVVSISPRSPLNAKFTLQTESDTPQTTRGSLIGIWPDDPAVKQRLVAGAIPATSDADGILLDEFTAYKLGYHSQEQLDSLVDRQLEAHINIGQIGKSRPTANLLRALGPAASQIDLNALAGFSLAVNQLFKKMDDTDLTPQERSDLQLGMKQLAAVTANLPEKTRSKAANKSSLSKSSSNKSSPGTGTPKSESGSKPNLKPEPNVRDLVIRGVLKRPLEEEGFGFLQFTGAPRLASVYINSKQKEPLNFLRKGFPGFWSAAGEVATADQLPTVVRTIEDMGLSVRSAVAIVEKLENEVGKARLAIGAVALLILLVAALGISNTMIIAVMERTPEFGIMKSLGATDKQVLWLVLLEGLTTGLLGAALALVVSLSVAPAAGQLCRHYIEARLKGSFDQSIFSFAASEVMIVFALAGAVCTFASLLPAWRAAKLDPVVAMKK